MTKQELDEIKDELKQLSPLPWTWVPAGNQYVVLSKDEGEEESYSAVCIELFKYYDAEFIAAAPQRISSLLDEIEKLSLDCITKDCENEALLAKCKRYEVALGIYGDKKNWTSAIAHQGDFGTDYFDCDDRFQSWEQINGYELAQKALEDKDV